MVLCDRFLILGSDWFPLGFDGYHGCQLPVHQAERIESGLGLHSLQWHGHGVHEAEASLNHTESHIQKGSKTIQNYLS